MMKTELPSHNAYFSVRLPEIIIWIVCLLIFIGIIFRFNLNAQEGESLGQDTIWLKSGEIIPCRVAEYSGQTKIISAFTIGADGDTMVNVFPRKQIENIYSEKGYKYKRKSAIPPAPRRTKGWVSPRLGSSYSAGIAVTVVFKNTMGFSLNYKYVQTKSQNAPTDYWSLGGDPTDRFGILSLCFVKEFYTKNRMLRFGVEVGPSLTTFSEAYFSPRSTYALFSPNYTIDYSRNPDVLGVTMRLKTEFLFTPVFGLELALFSNINQYKNLFGVEICINLGHVRDDKKLRK